MNNQANNHRMSQWWNNSKTPCLIVLLKPECIIFSVFCQCFNLLTLCTCCHVISHLPLISIVMTTIWSHSEINKNTFNIDILCLHVKVNVLNLSVHVYGCLCRTSSLQENNSHQMNYFNRVVWMRFNIREEKCPVSIFPCDFKHFYSLKVQ